MLIRKRSSTLSGGWQTVSIGIFSVYELSNMIQAGLLRSPRSRTARPGNRSKLPLTKASPARSVCPTSKDNRSTTSSHTTSTPFRTPRSSTIHTSYNQVSSTLHKYTASWLQRTRLSVLSRSWNSLQHSVSALKDCLRRSTPRSLIRLLQSTERPLRKFCFALRHEGRLWTTAMAN